MGSRSIEVPRALAATHDGIVTTRDLRAAGIDPRVAERQVRAGRWQRPARGVYVPHDQPLSGLTLGRVARVLAGDRVVVSGLVVLRELGLRWLPESRDVLGLVDLGVRTPSSGRVVLRRTAHLDQLDTWWRSDVQMAPAARAVIDAARRQPSLREVRGIVLGAVADRWADLDELERTLATSRRNGSALTRRALIDARRGAASPPEAELVDALLGSGVPFYVNPDLLLGGRLLGSPDIWLPGLGLGGEVESRERHEGDDRAVESTYDRHERMTAPGIELVHLSVPRIRRDPAAAAAYLLTRGRDRLRLPQREPVGLELVPRGPLLR